MSELEPQETQQEQEAVQAAPAPEPAPAAEPAPEPAQVEAPAPEPAPAETPAADAAATPGDDAPKPPAAQKPQGPRPDRGERRERPDRGDRGERRDRPAGQGPRGDRPPRGEHGDRRGPASGGKGPDRGPSREPLTDIDIDKLISDPLYLDNQAHAVVSRMRDMDSGTRSQLRRLYSAVRRACRAVESERQHQFVMLRARLAYTIARHQLRSLDPLERLLLQVTRKNEARGYERFRDLFEAIVAYNE